MRNAPRVYLRHLTVVFSLLAISLTVDADTITILGKFDGTGYRTELEVTSAAGAFLAVTVDVLGTPQLLEPDAGETQWDIESDNVSLSQLNTFLGSDITFRFITGDMSNPIESVYSVAPPLSAPITDDDFPARATNLDVTTNTNPFRPTATWSGGDPTADELFLTYQDLVTFDEFGDPSLDPATNQTSYTLQQDLAPGTYEATLAFWAFASNSASTLVSGPDVFTPAATDIEFYGVGETLFSPVFIVPIPATALLFPSGLLAGLAWARKSLKVRNLSAA